MAVVAGRLHAMANPGQELASVALQFWSTTALTFA
jgi:hypothetical protein